MIDAFSLSKFEQKVSILPLSCLLIFLVGCNKEKPLLFDFPVNSLNRVISKYNLKLDNEISYDGLGSIRIDLEDTATAYLFILRDIPVRRANLVWEAYCKSKDLKGEAFLEIGVQISGKYGEESEAFLHRSKDILSGTTNWQRLKVEFLITKNRKIDIVQLNLVVLGKGSVWIDQVKLSVLPRK